MFDFPASPTNGQSVTFGSTTYQWDGTAWLMQSGNIGPTGPAGPTGPTGPAGADGAPGPTGGVVIEVSDAAPSLPADKSLWFETDTGALWLRYPDPTGEKHWLQVNTSLILPPADGGEYVMVNGLWRLVKQDFLWSNWWVDVPVPTSWNPKRCRVSWNVSPSGVVTAFSIGARLSLDGTTFPQASGDYYYSGIIGQGVAVSYQAITASTYWYIDFGGENTSVEHQGTAEFNLEKIGPSAFVYRSTASCYNNAAGVLQRNFVNSGYASGALGGVANQRLKAIRIFTDSGTVPLPQSRLSVEWL